jgi:tetratricopeptide (TPR) repeat protein
MDDATLELDAGPSCSLERLVRRARVQRLRFEVEGYEEAVPLLREGLEHDPTCGTAYAELALTYAAWGLRRELACPGIRHEIDALEFQSLYDLAYDYADAALRLAPDAAAAHLAMAAALRRGAKADPVRREAEASLAAELDPDDAEALAERWRVRGYDPDDADLRRALELAPNLLAVRVDAAAALCDRGRYADALAELVEALRLAPGNVQVHYELAMLLDRGGLRARARDVMGKAREMRRDDPLVRLGDALLKEAA